VILLFELIVAAVAAHTLAGEVSRIQEWVGGCVLAAAGLVAAVGETNGKTAETSMAKLQPANRS
jgi:hypothetical protein